jgi:hypothetical protein
MIKDRVLLDAKDVICLLIALESNEAEDFESMTKNTARQFGEINYCINCSTTNVQSKCTAELKPEMFLTGLKDTSRAVRVTRIYRMISANSHTTVMVMPSSRAAPDAIPIKRWESKELNR